MSEATYFLTMLGTTTCIELDSIIDVYAFGRGSVLVLHVGDEWLECEVFEPVAEVRRLIEIEWARRRVESARDQPGK